MDREPAVAGLFYPAGPAALRAELTALTAPPPAGPTSALGLLVPHAGYVYSGRVAGAAYARVVIPRRAVVLAPNHTGKGARVALWPDGAFLTPLGRLPVDGPLTAGLRALRGVTPDRAAHLGEHALEVQLPFLQLLEPRISIAALVLGPLDADEAIALGEGLAEVLRREPALLVASSDMSHFVTAAEEERLDGRALERFLALDARGLHERVRGEGITMCGVVPATVMLAAAVALGARRAELVARAHSGAVNGDLRRVVGYASAIVS